MQVLMVNVFNTFLPLIIPCLKVELTFSGMEDTVA